MERLTVNKRVDEMGMLELAHNCCYAKGGTARYRDFRMDMEAREIARLMAAMTNDELPLEEDSFDDKILENLQYDPLKDNRGLVALFYRNLWAMADLHERLKEYEDLEEQRLLLKLQCKAGDIVYFPDKRTNYVFSITIAEIIISDLGDGKYCVQYNGCFFNRYGDPERDFEFEADDFGKTVFLTQAEAEETLARMEIEINM